MFLNIMVIPHLITSSFAIESNSIIVEPDPIFLSLTIKSDPIVFLLTAKQPNLTQHP